MNGKLIWWAMMGYCSIACVPREKTTEETGALTAIEDAILHDNQSFYYVDFDAYPVNDASLPVGVFDSGTGGLTVLDALVRFDRHDNQTKGGKADGKPDYSSEEFIYLADQANMPYGNYHSENNSGLLVEHVLKDAQFLLSNKYYQDAHAATYQRDKKQVKAIVIACNTATAYGKEKVADFIQKAGLNIPVIGVIDAGAKGALQTFGKSENGAIGVFATVGTIASKGYENTIMQLIKKEGHIGDIQIYNQGGHGIAEAVDEEPDFIHHGANSPRKAYRGPSLDHPEFKIERALFDVYNFEFGKDQMLCDATDIKECDVLQLNSAENYVRFHLVSLMEKIRKKDGAQPLKTLVLGCTHYPYLTSTIRQVIEELYQYQKDGAYVYRDFLSKDVHIIDPAENVALELYEYLDGNDLFNPAGSMERSEFYISVPNVQNKHADIDELGRFTYAYKYGRKQGEIQEYVRVVPFSKHSIPEETIERLRFSIPNTFKLIERFNNANPKTTALEDPHRIVGN